MEREVGGVIDAGARQEPAPTRAVVDESELPAVDPFDRGDTEWYAVLGED